MEENIREERSSSERDVSQTSAEHQSVIPVTELKQAGLHEEDRVCVRTTGHGRIEPDSADELLDSFIGCLPAGSFSGFSIQELREEWE